MFEKIQQAPDDPILGLTEAFKRDAREQKVNLGVGVYQDANGTTPVLACVKAAEKILAEQSQTKNYLPIPGDPAYLAAVRELLFPPEHPVVSEERAAIFHTPGGTGALRVAGDFIKTNLPDATVWLSDPTWANHPPIFAAAGVPTRTYAYYDAGANALAFDRLMHALSIIPAGDVVLLHGCCHNPTGVDPTTGQWAEVADMLGRRGVLPLLDFAYQGFGAGLDEDLAGVHALTARLPEAMICTSYSKNFGLYRERTGALTVVGDSAQATGHVASQIKVCVRRNYSNPPAHGGAIVGTILADPALRAQWQDELADMRDRINSIRRRFADELDRRGVKLNPEGNAFMARQQGMFSFSGLNNEQVGALRDQYGIYIVGSGRINVAGITESNLEYLCDAIAGVVS